MELLKQITEDIKNYQAFVQTIVEKIADIEEDLAEEKRLGLREANDYYHNDNPKAAGKTNDTLDFTPTPNVAKGQQPTPPPKGPVGTNAMKGRIQLMYNPATGKVENAVQAQGPNTAPAAGYVAANAQQFQDALKHIEGMDKELADKIVAGNVQIFVPQNPQAPKPTPQVQQHGGMNRIEMDPQRIAAAHAAADQMSYQK